MPNDASLSEPLRNLTIIRPQTAPVSTINTMPINCCHEAFLFLSDLFMLSALPLFIAYILMYHIVIMAISANICITHERYMLLLLSST